MEEHLLDGRMVAVKINGIDVALEVQFLQSLGMVVLIFKKFSWYFFYKARKLSLEVSKGDPL